MRNASRANPGFLDISCSTLKKFKKLLTTNVLFFSSVVVPFSGDATMVHDVSAGIVQGGREGSLMHEIKIEETKKQPTEIRTGSSGH